MARDPYEAARACFELARRGATEGERANGLSRGLALIEKHGLNPDRFDIPGRTPSRPRQPEQPAFGFDFMRGDNFRPSAGWRPGDRAPESYSPDDVADLMRHLHEAMQRTRTSGRQAADNFADLAAAMRGAGGAATRKRWVDPETPISDVDAYMADLDERMKAKRKAPSNWPSPREAVDYLFAKGVSVYDLGDDGRVARWWVPDRGEGLDDDGLYALADEVALGG